jgi:excisionase family DNA binding protein
MTARYAVQVLDSRQLPRCNREAPPVFVVAVAAICVTICRMGIMDFIRGELIEILEFNDDSRDTISWRFPDSDREIKRGAQLIVRESQTAQFVYLGQFGDTFGPGKYTLVTDNIPVLSTLRGWKYGFESPFKADVYFINTRLFTGNKWGTANPVMMRDQDFGILRLRAFGTFDFRVVEPRFFLKEVVGTDHNFRVDEFAETMRSRLVSVFTDSLATAKVPALDIASRYSELGEALLPIINPVVRAKYGLEIPSFIVENVSVPPEVEEAIDKRSSMSAVGNLNDYVKYQMGQGMAKGGAGGAAGTAAELAVGFGIAQEMMKQGGIAATSQAPELMGLAEAAKYLGVSEADVMAAITEGTLKAKKIGSQYRITKAAMDAFLAE